MRRLCCINGLRDPLAWHDALHEERTSIHRHLGWNFSLQSLALLVVIESAPTSIETSRACFIVVTMRRYARPTCHTLCLTTLDDHVRGLTHSIRQIHTCVSRLNRLRHQKVSCWWISSKTACISMMMMAWLWRQSSDWLLLRVAVVLRASTCRSCLIESWLGIWILRVW